MVRCSQNSKQIERKNRSQDGANYRECDLPCPLLPRLVQQVVFPSHTRIEFNKPVEKIERPKETDAFRECVYLPLNAPPLPGFQLPSAVPYGLARTTV